MFETDYDVGSVVAVQLRGQNFRFRVTPRFRSHYETEVYEAYTQRLVSRLVRRASVFLDVGANYGFYSLLAARHNPTLRVLACEPIPENADILDINIRENNLDNITVFRGAASSTNGCATMHRSAAADNCSFCPHPNAPPIGAESVATRTIDSLLASAAPGPLLVKIDTDGHEMEVLAGMTETIRRFPDIALIIEFNPKMLRAAGHQPADLLERLDSLGFAVFLLDDPKGQAYRIDPKTDWTGVMDPARYANLFCRPRALALSVTMFAHTSGMGGAERSLLELARELIDDHWCLVSVVHPHEGSLVGELTKNGAATVSADYHWWCSTAADGAVMSEHFRRDLRLLEARVTSMVRRIDPDIVWTQTLTIPWGAVVALALRKPHVWSVCEYGDIDHNMNFLFPRDDILRTIEQCSDYVFGSNPSLLRELFPELPPERASHLYRHIPLARPVHAIDKSDHWRQDKAARIILVGTLQPGKGQNDALHAVARLRSAGQAAEIVIAGEGEAGYLSEIRSLIDELGITDWVHIVGHLADPYPAIAAADIVLICSHRGGFCRSAAEAMLLGCAIVYTNTGGPGDYMIDGVTGLAYTPGDDRELASRIAELIREPERRARLGQLAREHAERLFTSASYGGKVYQKLRLLRDRGREPEAAHSCFLIELLRSETILRDQLSAELGAVRDRQAEHEMACRARAEQHAALNAALFRQVNLLWRARRGARMPFLHANRTGPAFRAANLAARVRLALYKLRLRFDLSAADLGKRWPDIQTILMSGLFDKAYYLAANPEVPKGVNPLLDYLVRGGFEGCDPNPLFDSDWYLEMNPDVASAKLNPLVHYLRFGAAERRSPHPCFDTDRYLANNPEVAGRGLEPLAHFLYQGWREGRNFGPGLLSAQ